MFSNSPLLGRARRIALLTAAAAEGEGPPTKDMVRLAAITIPAASALFNIMWFDPNWTAGQVCELCVHTRLSVHLRRPGYCMSDLDIAMLYG